MKRISAFSMIILLASTAFAQSSFFKGTLDEALAKARTENKKVLLDFNSYN